MKATVLLALLPLAFAMSEPAAADHPRRILDFPMQGYAGHFREQCIGLKGGHTLELIVRSPHPVEVNVHHHSDGKTLFLLDEIISSQQRNAVQIDDDGEYCFEVRNPENRPSAFDLQLEYLVTSD